MSSIAPKKTTSKISQKPTKKTKVNAGTIIIIVVVIIIVAAIIAIVVVFTMPPAPAATGSGSFNTSLGIGATQTTYLMATTALSPPSSLGFQYVTTGPFSVANAAIPNPYTKNLNNIAYFSSNMSANTALSDGAGYFALILRGNSFISQNQFGIQMYDGCFPPVTTFPSTLGIAGIAWGSQPNNSQLPPDTGITYVQTMTINVSQTTNPIVQTTVQLPKNVPTITNFTSVIVFAQNADYTTNQAVIFSTRMASTNSFEIRYNASTSATMSISFMLVYKRPQYLQGSSLAYSDMPVVNLNSPGNLVNVNITLQDNLPNGIVFFAIIIHAATDPLQPQSCSGMAFTGGELGIITANSFNNSVTLGIIGIPPIPAPSGYFLTCTTTC